MGETDFHKCKVFVGHGLYPFQEDMSRTLNREPFAYGSQAGLRGGEKPGACVDEPWLLVPVSKSRNLCSMTLCVWHLVFLFVTYFPP